MSGYSSRSLKLESIRPQRPYILSVLKILAPKPLNVYSIGATLKIVDPDNRYVYSIYLELPGGRLQMNFELQHGHERALAPTHLTTPLPRHLQILSSTS
jgi:hypothetical protein